MKAWIILHRADAGLGRVRLRRPASSARRWRPCSAAIAGSAWSRSRTRATSRPSSPPTSCPSRSEPVEHERHQGVRGLQNVQVLGDLDEAQFTRLMAAITEWVSPEQGCTYCHAEGEELRSRRALHQGGGPAHAADDPAPQQRTGRPMSGPPGVNCYTCHRGQPVPTNIWFTDPGRPHAQGMAGNPAGQNAPAPGVGLASLPYDPFTPFLARASDIRVVSTTALPEEQPAARSSRPSGPTA